MIFTITRTSLWGDAQPCEEAVKAGEKWVIEINSLEDLSKLADKYGELVFYISNIEIYDDYRE